MAGILGRRFDSEPVWNAAVGIMTIKAGDDLKCATTETVLLWPEEARRWVDLTRMFQE